MAGLFFCLASAKGAGLLFCPAAIQSHTSVYSAFCAVHAVIPPTPQNSAHGFTGEFPEICHRSTAANTRPTQAAIIPPAPHWNAHTRPDALQRIPDTTATLDAVQLNTVAYYNKVYKGATDRRPYKPSGGFDASHGWY